MTGPIDREERLPEAEQALVDALRADYADTCGEAPIPSAGLVWWRASLRARAEAAQSADRSLTVADGIMGAAVAGAAVAAAGVVWRAVPALPQPSLGVILGVAAAVCIVIAPLAVVLALAKDS